MSDGVVINIPTVGSRRRLERALDRRPAYFRSIDPLFLGEVYAVLYGRDADAALSVGFTAEQDMTESDIEPIPGMTARRLADIARGQTPTAGCPLCGRMVRLTHERRVYVHQGVHLSADGVQVLDCPTSGLTIPEAQGTAERETAEMDALTRRAHP